MGSSPAQPARESGAHLPSEDGARLLYLQLWIFPPLPSNRVGVFLFCKIFLRDVVAVTWPHDEAGGVSGRMKTMKHTSHKKMKRMRGGGHRRADLLVRHVAAERSGFASHIDRHHADNDHYLLDFERAIAFGAIVHADRPLLG